MLCAMLWCARIARHAQTMKKIVTKRLHIARKIAKRKYSSPLPAMVMFILSFPFPYGPRHS